MRDLLAERLLARVMAWPPETVARERPRLQAIAACKYDEYQQFAPGMRFVESLALWLEQFEEPDERQAAFNFVMCRLVFISVAEMHHLVAMVYPDILRPHLLRRAACEAGLSAFRVGAIEERVEFKLLQRQCLFLGLSDGAHVDVLRRHNTGQLSHDQILRSHEISEERAADLLSHLRADLERIGGEREVDAKFRLLVLLDDFAGSGVTLGGSDLSYARTEGERVKGKIPLLLAQGPLLGRLFSGDFEVHVVLYVATEPAQAHLESMLAQPARDARTTVTVHVVQTLRADLPLTDRTDAVLTRIIDRYYDPSVVDAHFRKGGAADARWGFGGCALPLVLSHNTPNNSVALLWAETPRARALFPRVSRHREEP